MFDTWHNLLGNKVLRIDFILNEIEFIRDCLKYWGFDGIVCRALDWKSTIGSNSRGFAKCLSIIIPIYVIQLFPSWVFREKLRLISYPKMLSCHTCTWIQSLILCIHSNIGIWNIMKMVKIHVFRQDWITKNVSL